MLTYRLFSHTFEVSCPPFGSPEPRYCDFSMIPPVEELIISSYRRSRRLTYPLLDPTMNQGNNVPSFRSYIVPKQLQFNANASTSAQSQVLGGFSGVSTGPRQTPTAAPAPVQKSIFGTTFAATSTPVYGNIFDKPSNPVPAQSSTISNASIFAPSSPFNKPSTATPTTLSGLLFANNTTPTSGGLFSKGSDSTPSSLGSDISITKYVQEDDAFPHVSKKPKSAAREKI